MNWTVSIEVKGLFLEAAKKLAKTDDFMARMNVGSSGLIGKRLIKHGLDVLNLKEGGMKFQRNGNGNGLAIDYNGLKYLCWVHMREGKLIEFSFYSVIPTETLNKRKGYKI